MQYELQQVSRRQCLAGGTAVSLAGLAGCLDAFDSSNASEPPGESGSSGPLRVVGTERVDDGGRTVRVDVTVENTGETARRADLVVALSHTEAEGSIDRTRPLLLAPGLERSVVVSFRPQFFGESGVDRPESGEFRFAPGFENVQVVEDYPGLVTPSQRSAIADGNAWPAVAYDPGASGHNPGTEAPRSRPTTAWTAPDVAFAFDASGPVVADGTVLAGRGVRSVAVEDGSERWVHDGPARTSPLAVGAGLAAFGTPEDLRAVETGTGDVRWTVSPTDDIWHGAPTVAGGRVYAESGRLYAIDAASGEVDWTAGSDGSLAGPPPVADDVVLTGGDPLQAIAVADGSVRWSVADRDPFEAAAIAYDTVFALSASRAVALDPAEGRPRWFLPEAFQPQRIAVGNGRVYVQLDGDYRLLAIDAADGTVEWVSDAPDGLLGPLAASDGVLVTNGERGTLYGIDTETGAMLWSMRVPTNVPGSLAVADGVVYLNEPDGPLRALT